MKAIALSLICLLCGIPGPARAEKDMGRLPSSMQMGGGKKGSDMAEIADPSLLLDPDEGPLSLAQPGGSRNVKKEPGAKPPPLIPPPEAEPVKKAKADSLPTKLPAPLPPVSSTEAEPPQRGLVPPKDPSVEKAAVGAAETKAPPLPDLLKPTANPPQIAAPFLPIAVPPAAPANGGTIPAPMPPAAAANSAPTPAPLPPPATANSAPTLAPGPPVATANNAPTPAPVPPAAAASSTPPTPALGPLPGTAPAPVVRPILAGPLVKPLSQLLGEQEMPDPSEVAGFKPTAKPPARQKASTKLLPEPEGELAPPDPNDPSVRMDPSAFPSVPSGPEVAVILSNNRFYPAAIRIRSGQTTKIIFTTVNHRPAALIIERLQIQRWVARDVGVPENSELDRARFEMNREISANRITEIELNPVAGLYSFHDALTGARGEILVE